MKKVLLSACLAMLMASTTAFADFNHLYIFGDSLSDSGAFEGNADAFSGQRFTTDPGLVWVENLGVEWGVPVTANNPNNSNTDANGNNYAQGGAQVSSTIGIGSTPSPQGAQPITTQLQTYLASHSSVDDNALYVVWGGANDVFYNAQLSAGGAPADQISANIQTSAAQLNGVIQALDQHGAQVILVPLLPDIGQTPATIMTAIQTAGAGNPNLATALGATVMALGQPGSTPAEQQAVRDAAMAQADTILGVPAGTIAATEQGVAAGFTDLSEGFNLVLRMTMGQGDANVVPLDIAGFLNAVAADPAAFGFTNVTGFLCPNGALSCAAGDYVPGSEETFLFADAVHPTTGGHEGIADYALSVLTAPGLISTLPDVAITSGRAYLSGMKNQMDQGSPVGLGTWTPFVSGSFQPMKGDSSNDIPSWDGDETGGLIGAIYRDEDSWSLGISVGKSQSDIDWKHNAGSFKYKSIIGMLSYQYQGDMFSTNITGGFALGNYDDIERRTAMRSATRTHSGETSAKQYLFALTGRAEVWHTDIATLGPVYGLNYQKVSVDGYSETGYDFDSLGYSNQRRDSLTAELGVFSKFTVTDKTTLNVTLVREEELSGDKTTPDTFLVTLPVNKFNLPGTDVDDGYWHAGIEVGMMIADNIAFNAAYDYRKGDDYESSHLFNLGLQIAF